MSISNALSRIRSWVAEHEQRRALSSFTCGHCDRNAQCGRAPGNECIEKHEQISQGEGWRYRTRADHEPRYPYG